MPVISKRLSLLNDFKRVIYQMIYYDDDDSEDFEELYELMHDLEGHRYLEGKMSVPKSKAMITLLLHYGDKDFRQEVRFCKTSFMKLVEILENHPIFLTHHVIQIAVWYQVIVALKRFGFVGNGPAMGKLHMHLE
jgi:hypothetical protein